MKKILFVASEALPFISGGGLGDVMGALPQAIAKTGQYDVRVVLPLYSKISSYYTQVMKYECEFTVKLAWRNQYCGIYSYSNNGVTYYFIDNKYYFEREMIYGCFDDGERYAYFCKAVLQMTEHINFIPDILHANDWHSALSVVYLKLNHERYPYTKTVFTIHNIEYQGIYDIATAWDVFALSQYDISKLEYNGKINLLKGAIECCDILTTVSPRYAEEICEEYFSAGLHHIIRSNKSKIYGIINGIDYDYYNPSSNSELTQNYSVEDMSGKAKCKTALQKKLGMRRLSRTPIIAMISRLAHHKGFELVKHVMDEIMELDIQFVLLGTGENQLEEYFLQLAEKNPKKSAVALKFDKALSKEIYAGADIFLMPSKSEPCGLSQMIASRYGTVPIVHRVGGLYNTIEPFDSQCKTGNGITFESYNAHDMLDAINRTIKLYKNKDIWNTLVLNAMTRDFSWSVSAKEYNRIYDLLLEQR